MFAEHDLDYTFGVTLGIGLATGSWIGVGVALKKNHAYIKGLSLLILFFVILKLILNSLNVNVI